jgi:hypothetical protein
MKNLLLAIILGFTSLYGFSVNPVNPPATTGTEVKPNALPLPSTADKCSELMSIVVVTVTVTFTDCPYYDCCYPDGCSFEICIYDQSGQLIDCQTFDPEKCQYTFANIRAEEGSYLKAKLVLLNSCPCSSSFNDEFASSGLIPLGGGTLYINTTYCP